LDAHDPCDHELATTGRRGNAVRTLREDHGTVNPVSAPRPDRTPGVADPRSDDGANRRTVLRGLAAAGLAGAAAPLLAACGGDEPTATSTTPPGAASSSPPPGSAGPTSPPPGEAPAPGFAKAADVPVGGGVIVEARKVVVTQPEAGTFKAFSSTCTHQRCPVTEVKDDAIICRCHGSKFSIKDGSVLSPPATQPLSEVAVTVSGGEVRPA
jgi:nitrite reductase/ring-hydroxylating ferredoxin subunit